MTDRTVANAWVAGLFLVATCGPGLLAEEGRIPIYEPVVLDGSLGEISGRYVVTRNITAAGGQPVIEIIGSTGTEQLEIDLNGFALLSDVATTGASGVVDVRGVASIELRGGTVATTVAPPTQGAGILVVDSDEVVVEDVVVKDAWFGVRIDSAELFRVRGCLVNRADSLAISVVDSGIGTIDDNLMTNTDSISLLVADYESVTIAGNKVLSGNRGISVSHGSPGLRSAATIVGNTVRDTIQSQYAIDVLRADGSTIRDNLVQDNVGAGIQIRDSSGCLIEGNVARANGAIGISLDTDSSGNLVQRNVASGNGSSGIWVQGDRNQIRNNTITGNSGAGLLLLGVSSDNTFGDNSSLGNTGTPSCTVAPIGGCASPDYCDSGTGNTSFGTNLMPGGC